MSGDEGRPGALTVGSLLGVPLGMAPAHTDTTAPAANAVHVMAAPPHISPEGALTAEEKAWTVVSGVLEQQPTHAPFLPDGVESLTYDNAFMQAIEQVWFDGKVVYALDLGPVEVETDRVKVAQEYQIVYSVDLDEEGRPRGEPERVPGQLNIYDSVPGMAIYSPIWQFNYVVVPRDFEPNSLRSEQDCLASGYPVHRGQVFEN